MGKIKIRKELNDIVFMHNSILKSLNTQMVIQNKTLSKYEEAVLEEIGLPSNKFIFLVKIMQPYMDSVTSSHIFSLMLTKQYKEFLEAVLEYENDYLLVASDIEGLEYGFDLAIETSLNLEKKIIDIKDTLNNEIIKAKIQAIKNYQKICETTNHNPQNCRYCGKKLKPEDEDTETQCFSCKKMPKEKKPFLTKQENQELEEENRKIEETKKEEPEKEQETNEEKKIEETPPQKSKNQLEKDFDRLIGNFNTKQHTINQKK